MGVGSSSSSAGSRVAPAEMIANQTPRTKKNNKITVLPFQVVPLPQTSSRAGTIVLDDTGVLSGGSDSDVSRRSSAGDKMKPKKKTRNGRGEEGEEENTDAGAVSLRSSPRRSDHRTGPKITASAKKRANAPVTLASLTPMQAANIEVVDDDANALADTRGDMTTLTTRIDADMAQLARALAADKVRWKAVPKIKLAVIASFSPAHIIADDAAGASADFQI